MRAVIRAWRGSAARSARFSCQARRERLQVLHERRVEVDDAVVHEAHHENAEDGLAQGRPVDDGLAAQRLPGVGTLEPEGPAVDGLTAAEHGNGEAGDAGLPGQLLDARGEHVRGDPGSVETLDRGCRLRDGGRKRGHEGQQQGRG
jgi:hypothetical protein